MFPGDAVGWIAEFSSAAVQRFQSKAAQSVLRGSAGSASPGYLLDTQIPRVSPQPSDRHLWGHGQESVAQPALQILILKLEQDCSGENLRGPGPLWASS